jgi:glutathione peroxidase
MSGEEIVLSDLADQVILIVNTASKCGFTSQYRGLEELYRTYKDQGLTLIGCPCNQFGHQEPGNHEEITEFCELNFGVTFPLTRKLDVNGEQAHPLFSELKKRAPGLLGSEKVKWNFTKFLIAPQAASVTRYSPQTTPKKIERDVQRLIQAHHS